MSIPQNSCNAWIYLDEDEPSKMVSGTKVYAGYNDPNSCYQSLIKNNVYNCVDILFIAFFGTYQLNDGTYSIRIGNKIHPGGATNDDYLNWVMRDARAANSSIKFMATLAPNSGELTPIFSGPESGWQASAESFARNVLAFLQSKGMSGFDIDWEADLDSSLTNQQFAIFCDAIGSVFRSASDGNYYYFTFSPADYEFNLQYINADAVNKNVDFLNLQLYSGFITPQQYAGIGIKPELLACGTQFESGIGICSTANQSWNQQQAGFSYKGTTYVYPLITQWRLNSGNYNYEQSQQIILYNLMNNVQTLQFDDSVLLGAAPALSSITVCSGDVIDAIQCVNTDSSSNVYNLLMHGGNGGAAEMVDCSGSQLLSVSGYTGIWFGWNVVAQLTFHFNDNSTAGPFGTMNNVEAPTPFSFSAPSGQSIIGFKGSIQQTPQIALGTTYVIASLEPVCAG